MTTFTLAPAGAHTHAPTPIVVAEFPLNDHEHFRAELTERNGKRVIAIVRVKFTANGLRRGASIEFAEHRIAGIAGLLDKVLRTIAERERAHLLKMKAPARGQQAGVQQIS